MEARREANEVHDRAQRQVRDLTVEVEQTRQQLSSSQSALQIAESEVHALTQRISEQSAGESSEVSNLESAVAVKDVMLDDQNKELARLRGVVEELEEGRRQHDASGER